MNDYLDAPTPSAALRQLLDSGLVNVNERIADANERWTHSYNKGNEYGQLDYLLLSPPLAASNSSAVPNIVRCGMPLRAIHGEEAPGRREERAKGVRPLSGRDYA